MITEALNKSSEDVDIDVVIVSDLRNYFEDKLNNINFKIAVNQQIVDSNHQLNNNDEVALLPQFAGG